MALTPEETLAIVKERKLAIPGFRSGSLGDVERCDVIADEIRADPAAARSVLDALVKAFESPPLPRTVLGTEGAADLLETGSGDAGLALSLWRVLSDRSAEVRNAALPLLDELGAHYFGSGAAPGSLQPTDGGAVDDPAAQVEALVAEIARLETRLRDAEQAGEARAEEARRKGEEQRGSSRAPCTSRERGNPGQSRSRRGPRTPRPRPGRRRRGRAWDTKTQWVKVHEKFSIPLACIIFGIIGIPLGLQSRVARGSKSRGFSWSIGILLIYYLLINAGTSLAERGILLLEAGMWAPNLIFLTLGIHLLVKAANEKPVLILVWVQKGIEWVRLKLQQAEGGPG